MFKCLLRSTTLPWLAVVLFAAFLFSHDPISQTYVHFTSGFRHADVERVLNWGFISIGLLLIFVVIRRSRDRLRAILLETVFIGLLLYALDRWLIFTYLERIHFLQYALLAFLLRKMTTKDFPALLLLNGAGIVDEFIQYIWNPQYTKYLDFNDMLLNLGGGMLGLLLFHALCPKETAPLPVERRVLLTGTAIHLLLGMIFFAGLLLGRVTFYAEGLETNSVWQIVDGSYRFVVAFAPQGGEAFSPATQKYCRILSVSQWIFFTLAVAATHTLLIRWLHPRS
ncbi:MAG: hypothetical protein PHX58_14350 [Desulfovibrio sp.]|nr:hypothetical protein [Desulfovibrio sp.]